MRENRKLKTIYGCVWIATNMDIQQLQKLYIESLSEKEKQAYEIARSHLGSSFSLEKSLGFLRFCEKINKHN